jgi:hypothetical protein
VNPVGEEASWHRVGDRPHSGFVEVDSTDFGLSHVCRLGKSFQGVVANRHQYTPRHLRIYPECRGGGGRSLENTVGKMSPPLLIGVVHDDFDPKYPFAFGIDLQRHSSIMDLEDRHVIRRFLDHDSPSSWILLALVIVRAILVRGSAQQASRRSRPSAGLSGTAGGGCSRFESRRTGTETCFSLALVYWI